MNFKPQEFAQSGINFSLFVANTVLNGVERLAVLNLAASRSALEAGISNLNILLGAKDLPSLIELQKSIATPSLEKGVEYSRNVIAIASETKDKIAKEVEIHVADTKAKVSGLVEKALESAPAGSEVAVAAVKSAMQSANEAMGNLNKVAKQAAEVTEASVAAATEATIQAAGVAAAPKASSKKAA